LEDISLRFDQKSKLDRCHKVAHGVVLVGFRFDSAAVATTLKLDCCLRAGSCGANNAGNTGGRWRPMTS
jgi:hypothetical protein